MANRPPTLLQFLESSARALWIKEGQYEVYVRRGFHSVEGKIARCLDLASVSTSISRQGKGQFKSLLDQMVELGRTYGLEYLFVESVLNERLGPYLERYGMTLLPNSLPPSYYLRLNPVHGVEDV